MRILFIGDIVGKAGRKCLQSYLPELKKKEHFDFICANGENSAGGAGITEKVFIELRAMGIDVITGGNISGIKKIYLILSIANRE